MQGQPYARITVAKPLQVPAIGEGDRIQDARKTESQVLRVSIGNIHNDQHR